LRISNVAAEEETKLMKVIFVTRFHNFTYYSKIILISMHCFLIISYFLFSHFKGHGIDPGEAKGSPINITDFVAGDAFIEEDDGVDHVMEAIENGIDYEGDMVLTNEQLDLHKGRAATSQLDKKWPKVGDMVQIPYVISSSFSQRDRNVIAKALQQYESKTCLR
jgi:hypothetical protein